MGPNVNEKSTTHFLTSKFTSNANILCEDGDVCAYICGWWRGRERGGDLLFYRKGLENENESFNLELKFI